MNENEKRSLVAHIREQGREEPLAPGSEFENALFAERIRDYLSDLFGDEDPAKYI